MDAQKLLNISKRTIYSKVVQNKEIYFDVEKSIDYAFQGKFVLKLYDYLKVNNAVKQDAEDFINSSTAYNISCLIEDLDQYIKGGSDQEHKQLREGYGHISKPQARKIKDYLKSILDDAKQYSYEKRKGRKRKQSK